MGTVANSAFTTGAMTVGITAGSYFFVNGKGPYAAAGTVAAGGNGPASTAAGTHADDFGNTDVATSTDRAWGVQVTMSDSVGIAAGDILALHGRRYKVKSVSGDSKGKVVLTDNVAGGQLVQLCSTCVTAVTVNGKGITLNKKLSLNVNDQILVGGYVHTDLQMSVKTAVSDGTAIVTSIGCNKGTPVTVNSPSGTATAVSHAGLPLYKAINTNNYVGSKITESASALTYQYVSQCSGRGNCDSATGVCGCYPGYGNDNCDEQNAAAM